MADGTLAICPACDSVAEPESAAETVQAHNDLQHDGEDVAQVIDGDTVNPDEVDRLLSISERFSREQHSRFIRTVMDDDRFDVGTGDADG